MSAAVGQDWRPKTLRELFIQYQARLLESWHHTAHLMGCWAAKNTRYEKLHPYVERQQPERIRVRPLEIFSTASVNQDGERISILKELFSAN